MNGKVVTTYVNVFQAAADFPDFTRILTWTYTSFNICFSYSTTFNEAGTIFVKLGVPEQHHKTLYAL